MKIFSPLIALLLLAASVASAQSLAEVAKKEEARRKAIKTPSKVITDEDLKRYQPLTPPQQPATPATPPAGQTPAGQNPPSATDAAQPPAGGEAAAEQEPAKDEAWWRKRITEARDALERSQLLLAALESRANALWADFTARDDPAERAVIANERAKTLAGLERMKEEIAAKTKAIADIEEEARQAGVPPGWLR